uniref:Merozoite surface protein 7 n=1 Tax=Plasmodium simiovale TaxID=35085 RepID=A0A1L2DWB0_PLASM|nr:merozoite surface protein 7 [Plasmodium simiovale]
MKSGIVLVSCLLLLCAGPILGEENKKEKQNMKKEDEDNNKEDDLETVKGRLQNLKAQFQDEKLLKKITEEQILKLKKKMEEFKNLKSEQEAKWASRRGHTSPGDNDELDLIDEELSGQSDNPDEDPIMVSRSGGGEGGTGGIYGQGDTDSPVSAGGSNENDVDSQSSSSEEDVTEVRSREDPQGQSNGGGSSNPTGDQGDGASESRSESASVSSSEGASRQVSEPVAEVSDDSINSADPTSQARSAASNQVNPEAQVNHVDILYDELLAGDNKKNIMDEGKHHSAYNNFRKQYDKLVLNQTEYDISLKLLDTMLSNGTVQEEKKNAIAETFKKAMYDKEYSEKFKNLISGVYGFAKRNNFLDGDKIKVGDYNKLFDYVSSLMNTLEL